MSILFSCQNDDEHIIENQLRQALPGEEFHSWPDCPYKAIVDMAVIFGAPEDFFDDLVNLKVIFSLAAGVEHVLNHAGLPAEIPIVRLEDAGMGDKMAEYVLYGVLHAQRKFGVYAESQRQRVWAPEAGTTHAKDFRVGILGLGTLGTSVAARLLINGYAVSGWSRSQKTVAGVEHYHGEQGLRDMMSTVDALVCLLPLTGETTRILNTALFNQAKPGLFLVNLARGGHLADADLLDALDRGQLSGALLDVTDPEPLPEGHPFWTHQRIILTPHISGPTQEQESVQQIVENIIRFRSGNAMTGLVNRQAGY